MRSTRAIRTRKVRGTIYKANFQQGALVINNELRDFRVFLNFVVRLEILAGARLPAGRGKARRDSWNCNVQAIFIRWLLTVIAEGHGGLEELP